LNGKKGSQKERGRREEEDADEGEAEVEGGVEKEALR